MYQCLAISVMSALRSEVWLDTHVHAICEPLWLSISFDNVTRGFGFELPFVVVLDLNYPFELPIRITIKFKLKI